MIARSALVLSTALPEASGTGAGRRVGQVARVIEAQGYTMALLLYPLAESALRRIVAGDAAPPPGFGYVSVIPTGAPGAAPPTGAAIIDAAWNEMIGHHLTWLLRHRSFDLVLVTDPALTRAFEFFPVAVLRLLDAHAGFGLLRQALATSRGVDATAVQVTPAQESMVYARAHAVLAGSAAAAAALDERHFGRTIHLPYWDDSGAIAPPAAERRFSRIRPLRLAFPEPEGPGQAAERHAFLQVLARCIILYDPPVAPVGVEEPGGSAGPPDILILLEEPSPGQDIAMAEAMRHGLPVLARQGASRRTLAEAIVRLAFAEDSVQDLRLAAACWAAKRGAEHAAGTQALALWLREGSRRILVIADRPFWLRDHFMAESLAQALEFVSRIGRVVLCCVTERPPPADAALPPLDCLHEPDAGALAAALQRLTERVTFTGAVFLSTEYAVTIPLADVLVAWSLPVWHLGLEADGVNTGLVFRPQAEGLGLPVSCLKYVPPKAVRPAQPLPHLLVLAPQAASRWQDIVLRYSALEAGAFGYEMTRLAVVPRSERDPTFFAAVMAAAPTRVMCVVDEVFWPAMLEDHFDLLGVPLMTIHSDGCTPAAEPWSLAGAIRAFLLSGRVASRAEAAGWDDVYVALRDFR